MAMAVILGPLNDMLADAASPQYVDAQSALEAADTVRDAVEALGLLDALSDDDVTEAEAVFDAFPAAVDEAIIAALENAFERAAPVVVEWLRDDDATIAVRVSEDADPLGRGPRVRLDVVSPHGQMFV